MPVLFNSLSFGARAALLREMGIVGFCLLVCFGPLHAAPPQKESLPALSKKNNPLRKEQYPERSSNAAPGSPQAGQVFFSKPSSSAESNTEDSLALIRQLSSEQYEQREIASHKLSKKGPQIVLELEKAIRRGNLEIVERAFQVLQAIEIRQLPESRSIGMEVLNRFSESGSGSTASRARVIKANIAIHQRDQAVKHLQTANIRSVGNKIVGNVFFLRSLPIFQITDNWNQDESSLAWLQWMHETDHILLNGKSINALVIQHVAKMPKLRKILISETMLSVSDLEPLQEMERIDFLGFWYMEIDDLFIDFLGRLPLRGELSLVGTRISSEGIKRLKTKLPRIKVQYRHGGFMGIESLQFSQECEISSVIPNGSAHRAGLRSGDIITGIDDVKIEKFDDLRKIVGERFPGDSIKVTYRRSGESNQLTLVLGRMEIMRPVDTDG